MQRFDYQKEGAVFLASRRRALLLDAPGLGKTVQAIDAADLIGARSLEVVSPASIVTQWSKEHANLSSGTVRFGARSYERARDHGLPSKIGALGIDEFHYCKNPHSKRTTALLGTQRYGVDGRIHHADYVWGLSGTAAPKDASDLFPVLNAIVPGALSLGGGRTMDYWQYMRKFCVMYDSGYGMVVKSSKNLDELKDRMAPYVLRRTKKDVFKDWKEPICAELWLDPGEVKEQLRKADLENEAKQVAEVFRKQGFEGLKELARVEQTGISRYRRYVGLLKVTPVVQWILDQYDDGLEKLVIVCVHREVIQSIHEKLLEQKIKSVFYWGGMDGKEKDKAKALFIKEADCRALIGQIDTFGTGLDGLQHATGDILFAEWSWLADINYQAISRLDRIGQQNPVLARFAGLDGSLDGAIMAKAAQRAQESKSLFG